MSTKTKNSNVKSVNNFNPLENLTLSNLDYLKEKSVQSKTVSALTIARQSTIKETEKNTRSVSSYFKEFRKNFAHIETYLKEAHKRERTFNTEMIQDILMNGNLKALTDADLKLTLKRETEAIAKGKKFSAPTAWTASRMFNAFIFAVETTEPKKAK